MSVWYFMVTSFAKYEKCIAGLIRGIICRKQVLGPIFSFPRYGRHLENFKIQESQKIALSFSVNCGSFTFCHYVLEPGVLLKILKIPVKLRKGVNYTDPINAHNASFAIHIQNP